MSNLEYHSNQALGSTTLKKIENNSMEIPHDMKYREIHAKNSSYPDTMSAGLRMGQMIHTAILEPDNIDADLEKYCKRNKNGSLSAVGIKEHAFIQALTSQIQDLKKNDSSTRGEFLRSLIHTETSIFWEQDGIECKARLDGYTKRAMGEVKSIRSGANYITETECRNYHVQLAWYMIGAEQAKLNLETVYMFWVETYGLTDYSPDEILEKPIKMKLFEVMPKTISEGYAKAQHLFERYKSCKEKNDWFDKQLDEIGSLELRPFAFQFIKD